MAYMSVKQAAEKWQIDEEMVTDFCLDGSLVAVAVSYTHLTLPTILLV